MPPRFHDRAVAAVERFGLGEYGATVRDRGIWEQTQVGQGVPRTHEEVDVEDRTD